VDQKIRRETWSGSIPVVLRLHEFDGVAESPSPFYLMLPRTQYLHVAFSRALEYFSEGSTRVLDDYWFKFKEVPLRAHLPAGVLFDAHASTHDLPWHITVCSSGAPDNLQRFPKEDSVKAHFVNCCKEAAYLRFGSSNVVFNLSTSHQDALWSGLKEHNYETYRKSAELLMPKADIDVRFLPIRVVFRNKPTRQRPATSLKAGDAVRTLGDLVAELFPEEAATMHEKKNVKFIVHGVCPPYDTPLAWMCQHLAHPDTFLYITIAD